MSENRFVSIPLDVMKTSALLLFIHTVSHASPVYQLHEWGTFTTVSGSDGTLLTGLEREEETLPAFAHAHIGLENGQMPAAAETNRIFKSHGTLGIPSPSKGLGKRPLAGVTVKMETPVIYFHSDEKVPIQVNVKVGFNGGTISQWYPQRSGGEVLPEPAPSKDPENLPTPLSAWKVDFNQLYQGAIKWEIDILTPEQTRAAVLFKPGDSLGWLRARLPATNAVRSAAGETEGFLFYRGVGRFDPGMKTSVTADETLHLQNLTGGKIPYLVAFEMADGKLRWTEKAAGIDAGGSISIPESDLIVEPSGFAEPLYHAMKTGLARCGLTDAEARSMVETWWHSYFEAPGLRVFWVLPNATTERILPLTVTPPPNKIVRVIVGRSEILRPRQEAQWLAASRKTGDEANAWNSLVLADRFGLAINERVKALENGAAIRGHQ